MNDMSVTAGSRAVLERDEPLPASPGVRSGADYLRDLQDGRTVIVDGRRVPNIVEDPRFRGIARTVAAMYDFAADPDNGMQFSNPETGGTTLKPYMIPRSAQDFAARREAIGKWSALTGGFVGRSPDHVAGLFAGFAGGAQVFRRDGFDGSDNVVAWYRKIASESRFVAYAITPPQTSRVPDAHEGDEPLQVAVVRSEPDGIVVRGAQMLATSAAVADLLFVSCIQPLAPGDEKHALSFILPVNTPGLRLYCRRPYASRTGDDGYDYPLTARFDESDAVLVFDDVFVPRENIFVCQDVDGVREQFYATPAHAFSNHQAQVRLVTKLKFVLGVARKVCAAHQSDTTPSVVEKLGELASFAALVEASTVAAESMAALDANGVMVPNRRFLYGAMGLQSEIYPRVIQIFRELVGGGPIQMPSSRHEMLNEETRDDMRRYARSKGATAEDRVQLLKLAWDVIGSEFGSRHVQYEMFYAGPPFVARMMSMRYYDYREPVGMVDAFLSTYGPENPDGRLGTS
ncbi:MAG TPA: 4-hydroxyphenylacetate 3-hydroxylase N-terminal domain-containing protein [Jatrophihabitans sp.]|jgi:4-hydroxyphenylacetate 3-monooxygenase|uniref:4-hydroxyphenylacetate 3-hydroxylase family protein n=1 Tax=Jatrophihabitans sp. TaxID=1932789 RepID=UPI002F2304E7